MRSSATGSDSDTRVDTHLPRRFSVADPGQADDGDLLDASAGMVGPTRSGGDARASVRSALFSTSRQRKLFAGADQYCGPLPNFVPCQTGPGDGPTAFARQATRRIEFNPGGGESQGSSRNNGSDLR